MRNIKLFAISTLVLALACACAKDNGFTSDSVKSDGFGIVANVKSANTKSPVSDKAYVFKGAKASMTVTTSDISLLPATKSSAPGLCNSKSDFERLYAKHGIGVYRLDFESDASGFLYDNFRFTMDERGLWKDVEKEDRFSPEDRIDGFLAVAPYSDEGRYYTTFDDFFPEIIVNNIDGKEDLLVGIQYDEDGVDCSVPVTVDFQHVLSAVHFKLIGVPSEVNIDAIGVLGWFNQGAYTPVFGMDLWGNLSIVDDGNYVLVAGEDFKSLDDLNDSYLFLIPSVSHEGYSFVTEDTEPVREQAQIGIQYTVEGSSEPEFITFPIEFEFREDAITNITIMFDGGYVVFTSDDAQTVKFTATHPENTEYSYDSTNWTVLGEAGDTVNVGFLPFGNGQPIYFRAHNIGNNDPVGRFHFGNQDVPVHVDGNIMSLVNFADPGLVDMAGCSFAEMFCGQICLKNAPVLPATTLSPGAYGRMFESSGVIVAPDLPALNLEESCYSMMFRYCSDLVKAPAILQAKVLPQAAYSLMFYGCDNLVKAPYISAVKAGNLGLMGMFALCSSLVETQQSLHLTDLIIPEDRSLGGQMLGMYAWCRSLKIAPELPAEELSLMCYAAMFSGCTNLEEAPYLRALHPGSWAYNAMFSNCKKLKHIRIAALTNPYDPSPYISSLNRYLYTSGWIGNNSSDSIAFDPDIPEGTPGVSPTGIIEFNKNIDWKETVDLMRGKDWGYPAGWTVRYFDPDEE